ncbi:MAG: serine hydrolase domain-containing protein [Bacteroidota bacterium]
MGKSVFGQKLIFFGVSYSYFWAIDLNQDMLYLRTIVLLLVFLVPASCGRYALRQNIFATPVSVEEGDFFADPSEAEASIPSDQGEIPIDWVFDGQSRHETLENYFKRLVKTHDFSGTVLIAENGQIVHQGAYGYANTRKREPLNIHSTFQLASVSKPITAIAALLLYEEGSLVLNEPVKTYLPEFPYQKVKVKHLLAHRSGLCRYMGLGQDYWNKRYFLTNQKVVDLLAEHPMKLRFRPGSKFQYNNTNYALLAAIIERLSGQSFSEFVDMRVFKPLGMQNSAAYNLLKRKKVFGRAQGYIKGRRTYKPAEGDYLDGVLGDKGVYSNVTDLYTLDQALYEGRLLKPETVAMMFQGAGPYQRGRNYGLGWRLKKWLPHVAYHFGWWRGFRTCFIRDMKAQRTIIILSNRVNAKKPINYWRVYQLAKRVEVPIPWEEEESEFEDFPSETTSEFK